MVRPMMSLRNLRGNHSSTNPWDSNLSLGKPSLRQRASEMFSRPFSRGPPDNPTPPPSRGEQNPFDRQYPPASYVRPSEPDIYSLHTREEFRKFPVETPKIGIRLKNDVVTQRITECAMLAKFSPAHYEAWIIFLNSYSEGCFNLNNLPQEPFLSEDWKYLPALYPFSELTRQAVADVLCDNKYTATQIELAEKILHDAKALFGCEAFTVSTFDELIESWHFSDGTQGWPEMKMERSWSLGAHALLSSTDPLVVLDTELDWRFSKNPLVYGGPQVRFFVAAPMLAPSGEVVAILAFYSQYPRERFTVKERRELCKYSELLFNTLWLSGQKDNQLPVTPTQSSPRPFSGSDLTSVYHNPGPSTPEQGAVSAGTPRILNWADLKNRLYENMPDSPTLGSISPGIVRTPRGSQDEDLDDVLCFLSRYKRRPDQVKRESVVTELTTPFESEGKDVVTAQAGSALLLWAQTLKFDALYIVHLDPYRLFLPDKELEQGGMNMQILASVGLPHNKPLDISIHLKALRAPNTATLLTHDDEVHCSRTFLMPLMVRREEPAHQATEGIIFGGYRRVLRENFDLNSMGMDTTEIRTLHRLCRVLRKTLDIDESASLPTPSNSENSSSRYPANEATEVDVPQPSARYPANEATEVGTPRNAQPHPSTSLQDLLNVSEPSRSSPRSSRSLQFE